METFALHVAKNMEIHHLHVQNLVKYHLTQYGDQVAVLLFQGKTAGNLHRLDEVNNLKHTRGALGIRD